NSETDRFPIIMYLIIHQLGERNSRISPFFTLTGISTSNSKTEYFHGVIIIWIWTQTTLIHSAIPYCGSLAGFMIKTQNWSRWSIKGPNNFSKKWLQTMLILLR